MESISCTIAVWLLLYLQACAVANPTGLKNSSSTDLQRSSRNFQQVNLRCPNGTYVKEIRWSNKEQLDNGIEIHCHEPGSVSAVIILRSHGSGDLLNTTKCNAVMGWGTTCSYTAILPLCTRDLSPTGWNCYQPCGGRRVMVGLDAKVENYTGIIDTLSMQCSLVPPIESSCTPSDRKTELLTCDAGSLKHPLKCSLHTTVGYGFTHNYTEEYRIQYEFYQDLNFEMAHAWLGLTANFKENLGMSKATGFDWNTAHESTFKEEVWPWVEIEASAGCTTQIFGIVGECAFTQVRPNYFQRVDNCSNVIFVSNDKMSDEFINGWHFISKVPANVLKHQYNQSLFPSYCTDC